VKDASYTGERLEQLFRIPAGIKQKVKNLPLDSITIGLVILPFIIGLPVTISYKLWFEILRGAQPRAWDGTGHYSIAYIYGQTIFPNTFGWTQSYFAGMPFPNFYPPLFYWCVALLDRATPLPFNWAFKLMVALPVLLLPASICSNSRSKVNPHNG
jgi:uncharacterized membrane protein